jgi:hypothetical protein
MIGSARLPQRLTLARCVDGAMRDGKAPTRERQWLPAIEGIQPISTAARGSLLISPGLNSMLQPPNLATRRHSLRLFQQLVGHPKDVV